MESPQEPQEGHTLSLIFQWVSVVAQIYHYHAEMRRNPRRRNRMLAAALGPNVRQFCDWNFTCFMAVKTGMSPTVATGVWSWNSSSNWKRKGMFSPQNIAPVDTEMTWAGPHMAIQPSGALGTPRDQQSCWPSLQELWLLRCAELRGEWEKHGETTAFSLKLEITGTGAVKPRKRGSHMIASNLKKKTVREITQSSSSLSLSASSLIHVIRHYSSLPWQKPNLGEHILPEFVADINLVATDFMKEPAISWATSASAKCRCTAKRRCAFPLESLTPRSPASYGQLTPEASSKCKWFSDLGESNPVMFDCRLFLQLCKRTWTSERERGRYLKAFKLRCWGLKAVQSISHPYPPTIKYTTPKKHGLDLWKPQMGKDHRHITCHNGHLVGRGHAAWPHPPLVVEPQGLGGFENTTCWFLNPKPSKAIQGPCQDISARNPWTWSEVPKFWLDHVDFVHCLQQLQGHPAAPGPLRCQLCQASRPARCHQTWFVAICSPVSMGCTPK